MPDIKRKSKSLQSSSKIEALTVSASGAVLYTLWAISVGAVSEFVSTTVYPFSYPFLHSPLHSFLPRIALEIPLPATPIFGAVFSSGIYYFEKNIFYRRINLLLKAGFAAVGACALVFVSSLIPILAEAGGLTLPHTLFYSADVGELPALFIYYYITSLPIFFFCGQIRRRMFALP